MPILQQDQKFEVVIKKLLLLEPVLYTLVPTELVVTGCSGVPEDLPVFQPILENIFSQDVQSSAIDAFELKINKFSEQTSQHNSLVKSFDMNLFSFNQFEKPSLEQNLFSMPPEAPLFEAPQIFDAPVIQSPQSCV